jgi:soluble lytic murein transglycosylase-like protein
MKILIILALFVLFTVFFFCQADPLLGFFGEENKEKPEINSVKDSPKATAVKKYSSVPTVKDSAKPVKPKIKKEASSTPTSTAIIVTRYRDLPGSFGNGDYNTEFNGLQVAAYDFSGLTPDQWVSKNRKALQAKEIDAKYDAEITAGITTYGLDRKMIVALITRESGGVRNIVSSAGAVGLTQLMPATAASYGVTNRTDPMQNVMGGCHYLSDLIKIFGNSDDALLAYGYGEGGARKLLNAGYKSADDSYVVMLKAIQAQL